MAVFISGIAGGGGKAAVYTEMNSGQLSEAGNVEWSFEEVDTMTNDSSADVTVTFKNEDGTDTGSFLLKPGESLNDVHFKGSGFSVNGTTVNFRYLLLR